MPQKHLTENIVKYNFYFYQTLTEVTVTVY